MSACEKISAFLDQRLEAAEAEQFEAHLEGCGACQLAVEAWRSIAARIVDVSKADAAVDGPATSEQLRLVQRAELERGGPRLGIVRLALAAVVLLALGAIGGYFLAGPATPGPAVHDPGAAADEGLVYRTDADSRTSVRLGRDAIHLGPASNVRVLESGPRTRLLLEEGSIACQVAERTGGEGFSVEANGFSVRVTGTRFLVDLGSGAGPARVVVSAGTVEVRGSVGSHHLGSGEGLDLVAQPVVRLASGAEIAAIEQLFVVPSLVREVVAGAEISPGADSGPEKAAPTPEGASAPVREPDDRETPSLERWRGWVIEGRLDEARLALRGHVAAHPTDAEAWSLLADCERKRASFEDAVAAYEKVVSLSKGEPANRARYKAAQLLQDRLGDHRRASELLERFVDEESGGSLLVDKARVRLARSLVAFGKQDRARVQLLRVIDSATDSETVATARQMLEQLEQE